MDVNILGGWYCREYQDAAWHYMANGGKRAVLVWPRRAGKDEFVLRWTALALHVRIGTYWHMLPMAAQARKAIWDAVNPKTGKRRIDEAFPEALRETTREQDMFIRFKNGSTWQVVGSDNYNSLVGSPPVGLVHSEYALADPQANSFLRPILAENGGWDIKISTPRGHNHLEVALDIARSEPGMFGQLLTVEDTKHMTPEALAQELRELVKERGEEEGNAIFRQEYYCSFSAALPGAYYGSLMEAAEKEGRLTTVPWEHGRPVTCAFDLGAADATAIWFLQTVGKEIRAIDYYEKTGTVDIAHYAKHLRDKPYVYDRLLLPHDANHERLGMAKSIKRQFEDLHFTTKCLPRSDIDPGIRATRAMIGKMWFDRKKCERGIDCLRQYHRVYDFERKVFADTPQHDWTSHGADALRTAAMGYDPSIRPELMAGNGQRAGRVVDSRGQPSGVDPWRTPNGANW